MVALVAAGALLAGGTLQAPTASAGGPFLPGLIAALPQPSGTTVLASGTREGRHGNGPSLLSTISADGRYVAFASAASDLVEGDTNGAADVFIRDLVDGTTVRALLPDGQPVPAGGQAIDPSISGDGRIVAFTYSISATGTTAAPQPVVLAWNRVTGETVVVSRNTRGAAASGRTPDVSADGRFVAFVSDHTSIAGDDSNESDDVFRFDLETGTTELVSVDRAGRAASGVSAAPAISADGRFVAFDSTAQGFVEGRLGGGRQVYVRDMATGTTQLVSVGEGGAAGELESDGPAISADGTRIAFTSLAATLVAGDTNGVADVFLRDLSAGSTTLASAGDDGRPSTQPSTQAAISADGRIVAFASGAIDLVAASGAGFRPAAVAPRRTEVYARDVVAGETALISVAAAGGPAGGQNVTPAIGGNGSSVAFASTSPTVLPGDDNNAFDVYVRDLPPVPVVTPATIDFGPVLVDQPGTPAAATVRNDGWGPFTAGAASLAGTNRTDFAILVDGCAGVVLHRADACTVTVGFEPGAEGDRRASLRLPNDEEPEPRTVRLRGTGELPPDTLGELEVSPRSGPPGIVAIATGSGWQPGTSVVLRWSRGLTPTLQPVTVEADGTFRVQVLVFHNDTIGDRELEGVPAADPAGLPATAPFRVVPPPAQPPSYVVLRLLAAPSTSLIGRR